MSLREYWLNTINQEANPQFIKHCLILGWIVFIGSLAVDLAFANKYFWFQRSGAVLCMLAIAAEFRLNQIDRDALKKDWDSRINDEKAIDTPMFTETDHDKNMKLIAHVSIAVGTVIWAYGDLLV